MPKGGTTRTTIVVSGPKGRRILTRDQLAIIKALGPDPVRVDRLLGISAKGAAAHICNLRSKLEQVGLSRDLIETVIGQGVRIQQPRETYAP